MDLAELYLTKAQKEGRAVLHSFDSGPRSSTSTTPHNHYNQQHNTFNSSFANNNPMKSIELSIDEREELQYEDSALKSIDSTFLNQDKDEL